jgi:hypothetical protein
MYSKNSHIPMFRKDSVIRMGSSKGLISTTKPIIPVIQEIKTILGHLEKR